MRMDLRKLMMWLAGFAVAICIYTLWLALVMLSMLSCTSSKKMATSLTETRVENYDEYVRVLAHLDSIYNMSMRMDSTWIKDSIWTCVRVINDSVFTDRYHLKEIYNGKIIKDKENKVENTVEIQRDSSSHRTDNHNKETKEQVKVRNPPLWLLWIVPVSSVLIFIVIRIIRRKPTH